MKSEYLYPDIVLANQPGQVETAIDVGNRFTEEALTAYPELLLNLVNSGAISSWFNEISVSVGKDPLTDPLSPLSAGAGTYFLNENVISGGELVAEILQRLNLKGPQLFTDWEPLNIKRKLGPGIGYIVPPGTYNQLLAIGNTSPDNQLNYTGANGTSETQQGIKAIMDAKIGPETDVFPPTGCFLVEGATQAIRYFVDTLARVEPNSEVLVLGLAYYTVATKCLETGRLKVKRCIAKQPITQEQKAIFFPSPEEIEQAITTNTSAIVITSPNNPTGEAYSEKDLEKIMEIVKRKNVLVLYDAIFDTMNFDPTQNLTSPLLKAAKKVGCLDKIVVADGLSKPRNYPSGRFGFLATTNLEFAQEIYTTAVLDKCNPPLTYWAVCLFEGLARKVEALEFQPTNTSQKTIINQVLAAANKPFGQEQFTTMYQDWLFWKQQALNFYQGNLEIVNAMLDGFVTGTSPNKAAYNTFVRLAGLEAGTNPLDFMAKLMATGIYTQVSSCFGLPQSRWQNELGTWSRITYGCSRRDLLPAVAGLIGVANAYADLDLGNPDKYPVLQIDYDNQI